MIPTVTQFLKEQKLDRDRLPMLYDSMKKAVEGYAEIVAKDLEKYYTYKQMKLMEVSGVVKLSDMSKTQMLDLLANIIQVCTGINPSQLKGRSRIRRIVHARHIFCHIAMRHCPGITLVTVGRYLNRDHSTIINARNAMQNRIDTNDPDAHDLERVERLYLKKVEEWIKDDE